MERRKAERRYISVVDNLKSVQSGACTREHSSEKSPHPVSLAPVYIRLTATSQLTSIHSLTPQHVSSIDTAALCAAAVLTARLVSPRRPGSSRGCGLSAKLARRGAVPLDERTGVGAHMCSRVRT